MKNRLRLTLTLVMMYSGLWIILTRADISSWIIGVPFVIVATLVSILLFPHTMRNWKLIGLLQFIPFFIWQSLRGGYAVARLAFAKSPNLQPSIVEYYSRLPDCNSRFFLATAASLLPGTLVVDINENRILLHAIDSEINVQEELDMLEQRIAKVFSLKQIECKEDQHV